MTRQARVQSPTDYYHIIMRGNNRENIFKNDEYKEMFIDYLKKQEEDQLIQIAAYCIMDNHVHIALKADFDNLVKAAKRINIKYAMKYNEQMDRVGHVFQDRYRSEAIEDDQYLLEVIRYIHNNPLKAKIVKQHKDYKWSSYTEYLDDTKIITKEQKDFILGYFSDKGLQFKEYHKKEDSKEFLEIKEDVENQRLEKGQDIIAEYFNKNGLVEAKQVKKNITHLEAIVKKLLEESKLSHRQIAKLLEISSSMVHKINLSKSEQL